ncbi:hypothetical protein CKAN_00448800 [Cinnamomum micranthum f. kanehirae]|uniref:Uncharacterized protein n=1 Tax=Cinnamomum micranthum f. kanehirae TaxID=337451 RepID=A0A3S3MWC9_9MAGN|nr:hypothetical protein CKAN_00448800 [Cinnamomum micranthum f. kanehirae]
MYTHAIYATFMRFVPVTSHHKASIFYEKCEFLFHKPPATSKGNVTHASKKSVAYAFTYIPS